MRRRATLLLIVAAVAIGLVAFALRDPSGGERAGRNDSAPPVHTTTGAARVDAPREREVPPPEAARGSIVRVMGERGPIAGARVHEVVGEHPVRTPLGDASTGDGYVSPGIELRGITIRVSHGEYLSRVLLVPTDDQYVFVVTLRERSAGIQVEVRGADGTPLPSGLAYALSDQGTTRAASSRDGGVSVFDLDPAEIRSIFAADETREHAPALVLQTSAWKDGERIVIQLAPAKPVRIRIVDKVSERPIAGAAISQMFGRSHQWVTDAVGETDVPIQSVASGKFVGVVWADGYCAQFFVVPANVAEVVRVGLRQGPWIEGTLLVDGVPVADAGCAGAMGEFIAHTATTNSQGDFKLSSLHGGDTAIHIQLPARYGIREPIRREFPVDLQAGKPYRWVVDLHPRTTEIRVVDEQNSPQPNARVTFGIHVVRSDESGIARIRRLSEESQQFQARCERGRGFGLLGAESATVVVTVRPTRELKGVLLDLKPGPTIPIHLDVKLGSDGAWYWIGHETVRADGSWTFGAHPTGYEYRVRAGDASLEGVTPGRPVTLR